MSDEFLRQHEPSVILGAISGIVGGLVFVAYKLWDRFFPGQPLPIPPGATNTSHAEVMKTLQDAIKTVTDLLQQERVFEIENRDSHRVIQEALIVEARQIQTLLDRLHTLAIAVAEMRGAQSDHSSS